MKERKKEKKKEKKEEIHCFEEPALLLHNLMICIYTLHQRKKKERKKGKERKEEGILIYTLDVHLLLTPSLGEKDAAPHNMHPQARLSEFDGTWHIYSPYGPS